MARNSILDTGRLLYDALQLLRPNKLFVYSYIPRKGLGYGHGNWGDDINIGMLEEISDLKVLVVNESPLYRLLVRRAYCCIGSILGFFKGKGIIVWGSGFMTRNSRMKQKPGKVYSVRGPLTREKLLEQGIDCPEVYGDPALLISRYYRPKADKKYRYGIIPHNEDAGNALMNALEGRDDVCIIRLGGYSHWHDIPDAVCSCEKIVSSSLHGLIVADSYGIPNAWVRFSDKVPGGDFKFLDYFQSVGRDIREPISAFTAKDLDAVLSSEAAFGFAKDIDYESIFESCPFREHLHGFIYTEP